MIDTILAQHHSDVAKAPLIQPHPVSLFDAGENDKLINAYKQLSGYFGGRSVVPFSLVGAGVATALVTGLTGTVVLTNVNYSTGEIEAAINEHTGKKVKSEWESSDASGWAQWAAATKLLLQKPEPDVKTIPSAAAKLRVDRLTKIQAVLGLPMQAVAEVLGITRPGLYKWLDATKDISLQDAKRQRLVIVERLTKQWTERSSSPLSVVAHEMLANGKTVFNMLQDDVLDEAAIISTFDELAQKLQGRPKSLSQRMAEAGFKRRSSVQSLPADE